MKKLLNPPQSRHTWAQVPLKTFEQFASLIADNKSASITLMSLVSKLGRNNAIVASYPALSELTKSSQSTIRRNIQYLEKNGWIEVRSVGKGSANAYIINDRVAWTKSGEERYKHSLFTATVLLSESEQKTAIEQKQEPLKAIPLIFDGEGQIPFGEGLPPPSQPILKGFEPDLPTRERNFDPETGEILSIERKK